MHKGRNSSRGLATGEVFSDMPAIWQPLIAFHDRVFTEEKKAALKRWVVEISIVGFVAHLILVCLARTLTHPPALVAAFGTNYLATIATPFNVILFYEVLTLIAALPASTTRSIANQFEIVSLIFIRDVYKNIGVVNEPFWVSQHLHADLEMLFNISAGFVMFFLVAVFQHLAQKQLLMPGTPQLAAGRRKFIAQKKVVAVGLTALLLLLAVYHLSRFAVEAISVLRSGNPNAFVSQTFFYNDLFTVMIFTDVLILILSLVVSGRYEMVFRNAAFVLSIILVRFSLTEREPYGAALAVIAMLFGILALLLFNYHSRIRQRGFSLDTGLH